MATLISFLGRNVRGYREVAYRFASGNTRRAPYIGLALVEECAPQRVILLGTAGSMWDVFFIDRPGLQESELEQLMAACAAGLVEQHMLERPAQLLANQLGVEVECVLIPLARDASEQVALLDLLARAIRRGEEVQLDVTHAFRHLPMLALVAARYLQRVRGAMVTDVHYGALEMTDPQGQTPVLSLAGLLAMLDWIEALATFDKDGDYAVFVRLLEKEGFPDNGARQLAQAAFFERTTNSTLARQALAGLHPGIDGLDSPLLGLFRDELTERLAWMRLPARHARERTLAQRYLERGDFIRTAIYLQEARISLEADRQRTDGDRLEQRERLKSDCRRDADFRLLSDLRNSMAHGLPSESAEARRALSSEDSLSTCLRAIERRLFR